LEAFYDQYNSLSTFEGEGGGITHNTFELCLGPLSLEKNLIIERLFRFFDQNHDGIINFEELVCGLSILCKGSLDERIKRKYIIWNHVLLYIYILLIIILLIYKYIKYIKTHLLVMI